MTATRRQFARRKAFIRKHGMQLVKFDPPYGRPSYWVRVDYHANRVYRWPA